VNQLEDYSWMALGLPDPAYADTVTIPAMRSGRVSPRSPLEDKLSYRARGARVGNRVRVLLMAPRKNRRDDKQDERKDAEHTAHLLGAYYPERQDTCPIAMPGRAPWWVAAATAGQVTAAMTAELAPGARSTAAASWDRTPLAVTTPISAPVTATAPAPRRGKRRRAR